MTNTANQVRDILVVGAGPSGLMMAAELARHGLSCLIIDKASGPSVNSKALGIQPRTLEIFDTLGIARRVVTEGHKSHGVSMYADGKRIVHVSMDELDSKFPFIIILPQSETERILTDHLENLGHKVEREVELVELEQTDDAVIATLRHADGRAEKIEAGWVIGCDGAHSTVRHSLNFDFEGAQYEELFFLADVKAEWNLPDDELQMFFHPDGLLAVFPFGSGRVRVLMDLPDINPGHNADQPGFETIREMSRERGPKDQKLSDPTWISAFRLNHRKVKHYRNGRVFLVGDAAHIHSPAGGQGMNTGLQDAYNLAWKLALVLDGRGKQSLLDTYETEREPVARGVLKMSDQMTVLATLRHPVTQGIRNKVVRALAGLEVVQQRFTNRISELGINYRNSSLSSQNWGSGPAMLHSGGPTAGDRAIDGELVEAASGSRTHLMEVLSGPEIKLLYFTGLQYERADERNILQVDRIIRERHENSISSFLVLPSDELPGDSIWTGHTLLDGGGMLGRRYAAASPCAYVIRPDGYIGYRGMPPRSDYLMEYLSKILM